MNIENKSQIINTFFNPYPIWVIDNFFNKSTLKLIKEEWPNLDLDVWHKGHKYINGKKNILEQGMRAISKLKDMPPYISSILKYIHTEPFTKKISNLTGIKGLQTDKSMRWSGLRVMTPGSFQAIHSDARKDPKTGYRKELTCLAYLNNDWKESQEGYFEVWDDNITKCIHKIKPLNNRLVIFLNTNKSYHGVPKVNFNRKSITWSILKKGESEDRSKALFVSRPQDSEEISKLGKERAYIKDIK